MKHNKRIIRTGSFVKSHSVVNNGTLRDFGMKELRRSLKLEDGKWIGSGSVDTADAVANVLLDEDQKRLVLFVVFTDKRTDPRIHLCAIARTLEFCSFVEFNVFLFGLDAQRRDWFGQRLGRFVGGIKSTGTGNSYTGMNPIREELREHGIEIDQMFLDQIDQSIKLIYMKDR